MILTPAGVDISLDLKGQGLSARKCVCVLSGCLSVLPAMYCGCVLHACTL